MNNDTKYTIEELADKVNETTKDLQLVDNRQTKNLSVRTIREYMTKNLLDKPFGQGKNKWFGSLHVDKLIALRTLKADGITDRALGKISTSSYETATPEQESALSLLSSMNSRSVGQSLSACAVSSSASVGQLSVLSSSTLSNHYVNSKAFSAIAMPVSKKWVEYPIDSEGKVFLKVEEGANFKNTPAMLAQIKSILNIGE